MIFPDSYSTTMGSATDTRAIISSIKETIVSDGIDTVTLNVTPVKNVHPLFITGYNTGEERIRLFTHPISFNDFRGKDYLCTDLRLFIAKGTPPYELEKGIRNQTEFDFAKSRAILNLRWIAGETSGIRNALGFASVVYANWLGQVIARAFSLDFKDQSVVMVIACAFYRSLFEEEFEFDETNIQALGMSMSSSLKMPTDLVFGTLDKLEPMNDIHDLCTTISKNLENLRPERFNPAILLNMVANNWYGQNAKEILAVAIEHPPTWITIVYTALKQRTYKTSMIYQVAERIGKRGASDTFLVAFNNYVKEQMTLESRGLNKLPAFDIPDFE